MDQQNAMRVRVSGKSGMHAPKKAPATVTPVRVSGSSVPRGSKTSSPVRLRQQKTA